MIERASTGNIEKVYLQIQKFRAKLVSLRGLYADSGVLQAVSEAGISTKDPEIVRRGIVEGFNDLNCGRGARSYPYLYRQATIGRDRQIENLGDPSLVERRKYS